MSMFAEPNDTNKGEETAPENTYSDTLGKRAEISSLLETVVESQQFLKVEIAEELKNSHVRIREEIGFDLRRISDKVNRNVSAIAQNVKSFINSYDSSLGDLQSSSPDSVSIIDAQYTAEESAEIARSYSLATKLMEEQCTLRQEIFSQLRTENDRLRKEVRQLVRRSEEDIERRLQTIEEKVRRVISCLVITLNQFYEFGDKMDDMLFRADAKVVEVENKLGRLANSSNALLTVFKKKKSTEEIPCGRFRLSSMSSVRTDVNSALDDTSSVCSFKTDGSSSMQDLKELVTRQNRKLLSKSRESVKYLCKNVCTCHQEPLKVDDKTLTAWNVESTDVDYDETLFWSTIETYSILYIGDDSLNVFIKTLVILSVTVQTKMHFYDMVTFCACQLRDPSCPGSLALVVRSSRNAGEEAPLPEPYIDWSSIFADSDDIFASLTDEEKLWVETIMAMSEETLAVWGTAYACLLLRLHDSGPVYVMDKLRKLNEELASIYEIKIDEFPRVPQCEQFFNRLKIYSNYEVEQKSRDTVYKGMIERYESLDTTTSTKQLLNFLLLKSLRYKGMPLLTLVDEVIKLYDVELIDLMRSTLFCKTVDSWKTFYQFVYSDTYHNYKKWKYCVSFDSKALPDLRFATNRNLCSLLTALIDVYNVKNRHSRILYSRMIKKHKPEWALEDSETKYLKTSLKLLQKPSKNYEH